MGIRVITPFGAPRIPKPVFYSSVVTAYITRSCVECQHCCVSWFKSMSYGEIVAPLNRKLLFPKELRQELRFDISLC